MELENLNKLIEKKNLEIQRSQELLKQKIKAKNDAENALKKFKNTGIITKEERLRRELQKSKKFLNSEQKTTTRAHQETEIAFKKSNKLRLQGKNDLAKKLENIFLNQEININKREIFKNKKKETQLFAKIALKEFEINNIHSKLRNASNKNEITRLKEMKDTLKNEKIKVQKEHKEINIQITKFKNNIENLKTQL